MYSARGSDEDDYSLRQDGVSDNIANSIDKFVGYQRERIDSLQ